MTYSNAIKLEEKIKQMKRRRKEIDNSKNSQNKRFMKGYINALKWCRDNVMD